MPYVVEATGRTGNVYWLSVPTEDGIYTLARSHPVVFETEEEASAAIANMPQAFAKAGILFTVSPHVPPDLRFPPDWPLWKHIDI